MSGMVPQRAYAMADQVQHDMNKLAMILMWIYGHGWGCFKLRLKENARNSDLKTVGDTPSPQCETVHANCLVCPVPCSALDADFELAEVIEGVLRPLPC